MNKHMSGGGTLLLIWTVTASRSRSLSARIEDRHHAALFEGEVREVARSEVGQVEMEAQEEPGPVDRPGGPDPVHRPVERRQLVIDQTVSLLQLVAQLRRMTPDQRITELVLVVVMCAEDERHISPLVQQRPHRTLIASVGAASLRGDRRDSEPHTLVHLPIEVPRLGCHPALQ